MFVVHVGVVSYRVLHFVLYAGFLGAGAALAAPVTEWHQVLANGRHVGHGEDSRAIDGELVVERERMTVALSRAGRRVPYSVETQTESNIDGTLRRISRAVRTGRSQSRVEARVEGDDLIITLDADGQPRTQRVAGAGVGLSSEWRERAWLAGAGGEIAPAPLSYRSWDPVKLSVVEVSLVALEGESAVRVERRVRSPGSESASWREIAPGGAVLREGKRLGTTELEILPAAEKAARAHTAALDHIAELLTSSPYRSPSSARNAKIRYGFKLNGPAPELPEGTGQQVWTSGEMLWLQVCASCEPVPGDGLTVEERARALAHTHWLEVDEPLMFRTARRATLGADDARSRMRRLTTFVRRHMQGDADMLGYGTALEALRTRHGDCTEYAVLLATLGRALEIPTRIAVGMSYARRFDGRRDVFVPHAWVQAWTGQYWENFDAALGEFDSGHLAFALSYDGSAANHFAGISRSRSLKLVSAARVVPRKAAPEGAAKLP